MDVSVHFTLVLRPISFVSVRRKWRKYFSNREKKKKKNLFSANGNESTRVRGGGGGYGHGGKMTVPYSRIALI